MGLVGGGVQHGHHKARLKRGSRGAVGHGAGAITWALLEGVDVGEVEGWGGRPSLQA